MDYKEKVIALLKSKELSKEQKEKLENIFPELKESEDEKVRKEIVRFIRMEVEDEIVGNKWLAWLGKQCEPYTKRDVDDAYVEGMAFAKHELEKQGRQKPAWSEEDEEELFNAVYACLNFYGKDSDTTDWLKSLKQRIGG